MVDDDGRVLRALRELIDTSAGMRVIATARSGPDALAADRRGAPDVALVDVMLPSPEEGLGVVRALTARGRRVIAMSVSAAVRARALAAGATAFVEKGPDAQPLVTALRHSAEPTLDQ